MHHRLKHSALLLLLGMGWSYQAHSAQDWNCDVDDFMTKAIGIEESWLENAGYLFLQAERGHPGALTLSPGIEAKLNDRVGMEIDIPAFSSNFPQGRASSALGPAAAGIKYALRHDCQPDKGEASLVTVEVEGQYGPPKLSGAGNSITTQMMWAQLWYPWFTQGEAGYTQQVGNGVTNGWFFNTSLGRAIHGTYSFQVEVETDNQWVMPNGKRGYRGFIMPQAAYHLHGKWLIAIGEQAGRKQGIHRTNWSTWGMLEREF